MTDDAPIIAPPPAARTLSLPIVGAIAAVALIIGAGITMLLLHWLRPEPAAESLVAAPVASRAAPPPAATDPASLTVRQETLGAEVSTLEQRVAQVSGQAATAAGYSNRAEALMVAFATRRQIDRGASLGYLEQELRDRFGTSRPTEVATIIRAGRNPVTSEDLRLAIDQIGPDLAFGPGERGWLDAIRRQLGSLVVIHRQGMPSPAPGDRLDRIRRLLAQRQVEAAIAEVDRLPGGEQAARWKAAAKQFVDAHGALDTLEATALQGGAAAPPRPAS